ncbi:hypothetical protein J4212_04130 [Candidatus Woesearchaeota archaeon]|nr:hypothetical protein [Candidatus Woesearchaeota archaeon]
MVQNKPRNTLEDVLRRRAKFSQNAQLTETKFTLEDLDKLFAQSMATNGFLVDLNNGGFGIRTDTSTLQQTDKKTIDAVTASGYNAAEIVYRMASKIILLHQNYKNEDRTRMVRNFMVSIQNLSPKQIIDYTGDVSAMSSSAKRNKRLHISEYFFSNLLPKVLAAFTDSYKKIEPMKSNPKVYTRHKKLLDTIHYEVLENAVATTNAFTSSGSLDELKKYSPTIRQPSPDSNIDVDYIRMVASGQFEQALDNLEKEQKGVVVGMAYSGNAKESNSKMTLVFADAQLNLVRKQFTVDGKLDGRSKDFLISLGRRLQSVRVGIYQSLSNDTGYAVRNIMRHL